MDDSILQKLHDFLFGAKPLQNAAQGAPAPTPQAPQSNDYIQQAAKAYMTQKALQDVAASQKLAKPAPKKSAVKPEDILSAPKK